MAAVMTPAQFQKEQWPIWEWVEAQYGTPKRTAFLSGDLPYYGTYDPELILDPVPAGCFFPAIVKVGHRLAFFQCVNLEDRGEQIRGMWCEECDLYHTSEVAHSDRWWAVRWS